MTFIRIIRWLKRGIYYCSRMISGQYETAFTNSHYENIKKVYSIWICMNPPKNRENSITRYYAMLKPGGAFARFANHPYRDKDNPILWSEIDKLYSRYYDSYYGKDIKAETEYSEEQAIQRAQVAEKCGFIDIRHGMF